MSNIMRPLSLVPVFGDLEKEFGRLLNPNFETLLGEISDWQPKIDIIEEDKQFVVKVDIPGVAPKDVDVSIERNTLLIKGKRETEHEEKKDNFVRYERSKGSFYRRIMLPGMVDEGKITAKGKDGVLTIAIPKSDKGIAKRIEVQD